MDAQIGFASERLRNRGDDLSSWFKTIFILLAVTLFTRIGEFNNPLTHVDDQFYLLTGKAMLGGELPYIDVWDRKPIGLFLTYAGIAAMGGDSVIVYHVVAAVAALATAIVIYRIARRITSAEGALRAAIVYLALLPALGGAGGQSPVFYNLLIAAVALLCLDCFVFGKAVWPRALWAMAVAGLAIQIKPTTMFEGAGFGLLFLAARWREAHRWSALAPLAGAMLVLAVLPTALAFATYAALGHAQDMWFATVVSNFKRVPLTWPQRLGELPQVMLFLTVPFIIAGSGLAIQLRHGQRRLSIFLVAWLLAAFVGYLSVPNFFNHYSLPLLVPVAVIMALSLADRRDGLLLATMAVSIPVLMQAPSPSRIVHDRDGFDRAAAQVQHELKGGCLYVYFGPSQFYSATNACRLSKFVFPEHLEVGVEATALPVDPAEEVRRVFRQAPAVVITGHRRYLERNNITAEIVEQQLWCDYDHLRSVSANGQRSLDIWKRKPGARPACPSNHPHLGIVQPPGS